MAGGQVYCKDASVVRDGGLIELLNLTNRLIRSNQRDAPNETAWV